MQEPRVTTTVLSGHFKAGWRCAAFGLASVLLALATTAQAAQITQTVTIGDKEWAQVNLFTDYVDIYSTIDPNFSMLTWEQVNAQCPSGVCGPSAQINSWDLAGWTWASSNEVTAEILAPYSVFPESALYNGGTEWSTGGDQLSPLLAATGFHASFDTCPGCEPVLIIAPGYQHGIALGGWTRDATSSYNHYAGAFYVNSFEEVGNALVYETHFVTGMLNGTFVIPMYVASGAWFYRQAAVVPVPAAAWLFGSGLLALFGVARPRKAG